MRCLFLVSSTTFADSFYAELQQASNRLRGVNSIGLCVIGDRRRQIHDVVEQRGSAIFPSGSRLSRPEAGVAEDRVPGVFTSVSRTALAGTQGVMRVSQRQLQHSSLSPLCPSSHRRRSLVISASALSRCIERCARALNATYPRIL
jgi:hypothetical protein